MLAELSIRNFAIVDALTLRFGPGFNVLTGETGAGKSLIVDAVAFLLGGKAEPGLLRAGADSAWVEGVFTVDEGRSAAALELLSENGLEPEEGVIILSREYRPAGRGSLRVNGRAATQSVLQRVGESLVDIHGQTEHLSLLRAGEHLAFLDRYGGLTQAVRQVALAVDRWRGVRADIERLSRGEKELARRLDLLRYEVEEIDAVAPRPGEDAQLAEEERLLSSAEQRLLLAQAARADLDGEGASSTSVLDGLRRTATALTQLARLDGGAQRLAQEAEALVFQGEELSRELRGYAEGTEFNPARLQAVQERLALLKGLMRKYADDLEGVLVYAEKARRELAEMEHSQERLTALREEEQRTAAEAGELAASLSAARADAAERLSREVEAQLGELNLGGARFGVSQERSVDDGEGLPLPGESLRFACSREGVDRVEFLLSANPGEPLRPLSRVASGGECSRLMLALKAVLARAGTTSTLIFDEIDSGLGGRGGRVVGEKLARLAAEHQVICVTHLPQIAGFADHQFSVVKEESGGRTVVRVTELEDGERVAELAAMLGGDSAAARQAAGELLEQRQTAVRRGAA